MSQRWATVLLMLWLRTVLRNELHHHWHLAMIIPTHTLLEVIIKAITYKKLIAELNTSRGINISVSQKLGWKLMRSLRSATLVTVSSLARLISLVLLQIERYFCMLRLFLQALTRYRHLSLTISFERRRAYKIKCRAYILITTWFAVGSRVLL